MTETTAQYQVTLSPSRPAEFEVSVTAKSAAEAVQKVASQAQAGGLGWARASFKPAYVEWDGKVAEVIGSCEGCGKPVLDGDDHESYASDDEGHLTCPKCSESA